MDFGKIIGEIGQENVFEYIRERQKAFPDNKNNKLKKSKIWNFAKGVSPWFSLKIGDDGKIANFLTKSMD